MNPKIQQAIRREIARNALETAEHVEVAVDRIIEALGHPDDHDEIYDVLRSPQISDEAADRLNEIHGCETDLEG